MKSTASKSKSKSSSSSRKPTSKASGSKPSNGSGSRASSSSSQKSQSQSDTQSKLHKLFEEELKDIYWAEKALMKALPKMVKNATSEELIEALENHIEETEVQVQRCEQVFELLGKTAQGKKCEAMEGLIEEAESIMEDSDEGVMRDAGIISAAQKVEHYEIASYGTLCAFAKALGLTEIQDLLGQTLEEEKNADEILTGVAESTINMQAAGTSEEEEEVEEEENAK